MSSHTKQNYKPLLPQGSRILLPSWNWWRCRAGLQRVDWCNWTWRRHYWFPSAAPEVSAGRHSFRGVTTGLRSQRPHGQIESYYRKKGIVVWLSRPKKKKKNTQKTVFTATLRTLRLTIIKGHCTAMWDCITVPINLGHNVRAVQLQGGKRKKISSSRRPCILATPLKRHSFCEPQGVLLWPAPNYANTYFDLEQTQSVRAKPMTRRGPRHGSSAQDAQLIRFNQVLGFTKDKKTLEKEIGCDPQSTSPRRDTAGVSFL